MLHLHHEEAHTGRLRWTPAIWERFIDESAELSARFEVRFPVG